MRRAYYIRHSYFRLIDHGWHQIPWALQGLISDLRCQEPFGRKFDELRTKFHNRHPKTAVLKEMVQKLGPIKEQQSRFAPPSPSLG